MSILSTVKNKDTSTLPVSAENEDQGMLLPCYSVTSVTSVTEESNKSNKGNEGNKEQDTLKLFSAGFTAGRNEQTKLAILLYDHREGLKREEISEKLAIEPENAKVYLNRLSKDGWVTSITPKPYRYVLTDLGKAQVEKLYAEYIKNTNERAWQEQEARRAASEYKEVMGLGEQVQIWREFFEGEPYRSRLFDQVRAGHNWVHIDFSDLAKHSPELAELLLDTPEEVLKAGQLAIEKMDVPHIGDDLSKIWIRVINLPGKLSVGELRTKHINKLVVVEAQIVVTGEPRPQVTSARFECPTCGNVLHVVQVDRKFKEPMRCSCGRKGKFKILSKELMDAATVLLQQPIIELAGKAMRPSTLKVLLGSDLTLPSVRDELQTNKMVRIVGVFKEVPVVLSTGGQSTRFDWMLSGNSVSVVESYNPDLRLTPARIAEIQQEAQRPDFKERLRKSFFPQHVGDEQLKDMLICQAVSMPLHLHTKEAWQQADREALHVLVMTPPGMGKSRNLAGRLLELVPIKGRANGTGATRAGLTIGADQKDKENDLVIPTPQALPGANLGLFVLDEADKMKLEEQPVLNEAMSEHTVTVAKRGVNLTLPAMVCYLGLANPRTFEWDLQEDTLETVLNLHYTTLTRCVVWVGTDKADLERDTRVALAILRREAPQDKPYSDEFLRDFILYARAKIVPRMMPAHEEKLAYVYGQLRKMQTRKYIGPRFVEQARALVLLHAKLHLREETTLEDLKWADDLLVRQLTTIGFDPSRLPNTIPRMVQR